MKKDRPRNQDVLTTKRLRVCRASQLQPLICYSSFDGSFPFVPVHSKNSQKHRDNQAFARNEQKIRDTNGSPKAIRAVRNNS